MQGAMRQQWRRSSGGGGAAVDSGVRAQKRALPVPAARRRSTSVSASIQQPIESARRRVIQLFYTEAFGNATPELLPSLCARGVTYSDALAGGSVCDVFGTAGLAEYIADVASSHPLLHVEVDDIAVDAGGRSAVAEWHATAAHLLPGRSGAPPTGLVSEICGCDRITFAPDGRIASILSFHERFAEDSSGGGAEPARAASRAGRGGPPGRPASAGGD